MLKIPRWLQPTPGQEGVGGAHRGGAAERRPDVELIIFLQKGTVNDAEDFLLMFLPVVCCQTAGYLLQLGNKRLCGVVRHVEVICQGLPHRRLVLGPELPQIGAAGTFSAAGIRHIKHIAQARLAAAGVHQGDAPGPTADIPAHPSVPEVVFRAGGGLRALGVDHQLLMVWVLIEAGGGGEKGRPLPVTARNLPGGLVCHLRENLGVSRHGYLLLPFSDQK